VVWYYHTCGTRVKPNPKPPPPPPAPPPAPMPPIPPPPPVHPPLGHQPNIVFILTDDQDRTLGDKDYTHLGSLAVQPVVQRELIAKGAFLQNFFVNTPICCPSRCVRPRQRAAAAVKNDGAFVNSSPQPSAFSLPGVFTALPQPESGLPPLLLPPPGPSSSLAATTTTSARRKRCRVHSACTATPPTRPIR
jgi:hypothetical protein